MLNAYNEIFTWRLFFMNNPQSFAMRAVARPLALTAMIIGACVAMAFGAAPAALAQPSASTAAKSAQPAELKTDPKAESPTEPKTNAKGNSKTNAKAEPKAPSASTAKPAAPTPTEVSATTPPSLSPIQVGELSSVPAPTIAAKAWITLDVTSGQVISSANADQKVEPASLTKIMTAYLAFVALKEQRLTLDQPANVSQVAWKTRGSRMFIEPRKPVTIDELIKGVIIQSGNDASVALAEAISGTESAFVTLMNEEAQRMGMTNTTFMNSNGLPDPQHLTTVRDLATLSRHMITDHPEYFPY